MKQRPCRTPRRPGTHRPALHPIGLAAMLALAGPAFALPQGATVVNGQVTIATPAPSLQVVTQGTSKAIIDWKSFSIGAGEKVRFDQPSSSAVLLNRVTGYDPSDILGQMQSNGRIFLLNPYGVVFGSAARIDVGGLVASSLSLSNADFLAGRYALNSTDPAAPAQRGAVRNDGAISAPGGVVVLAGPNVVNTGSIDAAAGRVGLAAAQEVLVDVEGDGLILFQAKAGEVGNRLAQLGRIQADGGSVELRAAARGAFADTVLNMAGTVQARSLGLRQGKVVIDGGEAGITRVAGLVDSSSPDTPAGGGRVEVTGQKVLLDDGARLDASGVGGGGTVLVGGDWQGQGPLRNAEQTHVAAGAQVDVSALGSGSAGTAVVWSDDTTRFLGHIAARGGAAGGDGGRLEVSGERHLDFAGTVDARAPAGRNGSLLLDPSNIEITTTNDAISTTAPFVGSATDSKLDVARLVSAVNGADVTVDATGDPASPPVGSATTPTITVSTAIAWNSTHTLTLKASGTISVGAAAPISNDGSGGLNLFTNGAVNVASTITLKGGAFKVAGTAGGAAPAASYNGGAIVTTGAALSAGGAVTIATTGSLATGDITTRGGTGGGATAGGIGGTVTLSAVDGALSTGAIDTRGGNAGNTSTGVFAGGAAGAVQLSIGTPTAARTLSTGTITATGGTGSNRTSGNVAGGVGGAGGTVQIGNADGGVSVAGIDSSGGSGGDAANNGNPGGTGGAAHAVTVSSATGTVAVGAVTAVGGAEGGGDDSGAAGARADITLSAGTSLTVTGALDAGTGTGASTIELKFGQSGTGGTLDLTGIPSVAGTTLKATGGASTTADRLVASSNAATITLTDTSLVLTPSTSYTLAAVDAAELSGGAGSNTINAPGGVGGWSGLLTVNRSGGAADIVHGNGANTTLVDRTNSASTYNITGANTGSVGNTSFDGVGKIVAGNLNDNFVIGDGGSLTSITGGTGSNTLDLSAKTAAVTIDLQNRSATDVASFSGITDVVGRDGTAGTDTTLIGTNANQTIDITGPNIGVAAGVNFFGVGNLTGGSGTNTFAFRSNLVQSGSLAGNLVGSGADTLDLSGRSGALEFRLATAAATPIGGAFSGITSLVGNDLGGTTTTTLIGANGTQTIDITAANAGLAGGIGFSGVGNITGGSGTNTFEFGATGSVSGNLVGNGADTLDLSARSGPIEFRLAPVLSEATPIGGKFSGITTLVGNDPANSTNATLIGSSAGQTFTLNTGNAGTVGSIGFSGIGNLIGGSGADTFTGSGGSLSGSLADGGGATTLNGTITTGAGQTYDGAVTLGSATVLASSGGGNIRFGSALDGTQTLAVNTSGTTTFVGPVGAGTALASLSTDAGGSTAIQGGSVRTNDTQTYGDAVSAGTLTLTSLNAGGHLQASNAGNDFGTLSLATTGATDVTIRDANALALGSVTLGSGTNSFTAGTQLSRGALPTAGSALVLSVGAGGLVDPSVNTFFTTGAASSVLVAAGSGVTHDVTAGGVGVLPGLVVSGNLTLNASAAITQSAALNVDGSTIVNAGANTVTLNAPANNLKGAITLNNSGASDIVLVNAATATQIGGIGAGSGALTITSAGPIGQSGAITQSGPGAVLIDAGANTITLTDANNDFAGTVTPTGSVIQLADRNALTLGTLAVGALNVTSQGALNLGSGSVGGDLVAASNGGAVTQAGALSVTGNASVAAGNAGIDLSNAANNWGGSVALSNSGTGSVLLSDSGALLLAGVNVGSGTLTLTAAGPITQSAAITQTGAGAVSINAGANNITLANAGNNFTGAVGLTGATVQIVDQNALALGAATVAVDLAVTSNGGAITQSGPLVVVGNSSFAAGAGSIALTNAANSFGGSVGLSTSGAGSVAVTGGGALQLGAVTLGTGALTLNAAGPVTQTAALTQGAGAAAVTIGAAGAVALDQAGNDFTGPVSVGVSGASSVSLRDANALPLGTLTMGGGALALTAAGDLTQTGPISAAGTTTIATGAGNVTLANAANNFLGTVTVSGAAIDVRDANDLSVAATPALNRSLSLIAGGTLTLLGGGSIDTGSADLTLASGTGLGTGGTLAGTNLSLAGGSGGIALNNDVLARGNLTLQSSNAPILQFGGNLAVTGSSTVTAGAAPVSLASAGNDFTGPVSISVSGASSVSLRDANALPLGTLTMGGGALALTAAGDITQTGPISAAGTTTITTGSGNVTLANAANNFLGTVTVSGAAIDVRDANDLSVAATPALNRSLSLIAGGTLTLLGGGSIDTGSADLTLASGTGLGTGGTLAGTNLSLAGGSGGIALNNDVLARGNLTLQSSNAPILQFGGNLAVAGSSTVTAGAAPVSLASAGNDFTGPVSVSVSGASSVSLRDANALPLGTLAMGGGALGLVAAGDITQTGTITVGGVTSLTAGGGNIVLTQVGNDFSTVAATGGNIGLTDANTLVLGPVQATRLDVVTGNAALGQSGAAVVSGATTVDAGGAAVDLTQAGNRFASIGISGGAVALVNAGPLVLDGVTATSLSVNTAAANGAIGQSAPLAVGGATGIDAGSGDVTLNNPANNFATLALRGGALNVADANDLVITSLSAAPNRAVSLVAGGTLTLPVGGIDTGTADLLLASNAGTLTTRGALAGRAVGLAGSTGIVLGGNVTSSTDQTYANAVTLAADTTLNAGAGRITLQGPVDGGTHDLGLASGNAATDAIRSAGPIVNTNRLTVAGNSTLGGNVTTTGTQSYGGRLTLGGTIELNAGNSGIVLQGAVDGGGHDLRLTSGGAAADTIRADGPITGVGAFTAGGNTTLSGGGVAGSGDQTYAARLTLGADTTLNAGAGRILLQGAVDGGGHDLLLASGNAAGDAIRTSAAVTNVARFDAGGHTTLGGSVTGGGDQRYAAALTLAGDATLAAGAGRIALQGAVDGGGHRLGLASSAAQADAIRTSAAIANTAQLDVAGRLALGGSVTTSGAQSYLDALRLDAPATLTGSRVAFAGTVDGAQALTLRSPDIVFGAAVGTGTALASLDVGSVGSTHVGSNITTSGTQTFGNAVVLDGPSVLSGSTLRFDGPVDGAQALTLIGGGATALLNGAVGADTPLASLSIVGPTTLGGGTVTTTGAQSYGGPVTLTADALLSGGTLAMNSGVAGGHALDLQFSGPSSLGGAIGVGTPLASLNSSGPLTLLADSISTSGAQTFGSTLQLSGNTRLSGGTLDFTGAVSGAGDLLLQTDTLLAAASITGTGTLAISPLDTGRTIGVAGGAGALQVSQAVLDNASGFARHVIGRADGSGAIDVGALRLRSNTTLQTGSGDIRLNGSVDGAFDLALNGGGTTRIAGPVGVDTALRSLSTDQQGGSTEGTQFDSGDGSAVRVFTSGAQTYADAVDAQVPLQLRGTTIGAEQAGNRFAGTVFVIADRLQLRSGAGLSLGDVTLADGGRIEADGVLRLVGALRLDGGTLSLVSNALPTGGPFTDQELLAGETLALGFTPLQEASATIVQGTDATVASSAGSLLVLRSPGGGSILLDRLADGQTVNTLLGEVSAVSGALGDNTRFATPGQNPNEVTIGFIRLASSEIHVAGAAPAAGAPDPLRAGLEADALKLTADTLTTGPTGLLRARLPFLNTQGSDSSLPGLTLVMSPQALTVANAFGLPNPDGFIQVRIGSALGGYLTVRPKESGGENAVILLAGPEPRPFYDGAGKLTEVRVFYNGDTPRTPQESGALTAVTAIVEDARHARFEEAVRTENVSSRLRSGVIAEVGSGRPATVGRESIKLPQNCGVKPGSLQCE